MGKRYKTAALGRLMLVMVSAVETFARLMFVMVTSVKTFSRLMLVMVTSVETFSRLMLVMVTSVETFSRLMFVMVHISRDIWSPDVGNGYSSRDIGRHTWVNVTIHWTFGRRILRLVMKNTNPVLSHLCRDFISGRGLSVSSPLFW